MSVAVLCLAYIVGLLATASLGFSSSPNWEQVRILGGILVAIGIIAALVIPRFRRTGLKWQVWVIGGIIAALAVVYLQVRIPHPAKNDISQFVQSAEGSSLEQMVAVSGEVLTTPRLTRSQRVQFWLSAKQLTAVESNLEESTTSQEVIGKLYVTAPLLQGTGVYPGQRVVVTGNLYKPKAAVNPGAFDFQVYLARQETFAGLSGRQVRLPEEGIHGGWWQVRQRIFRAQVRGLGSPTGQVVSSMVLGRKAVDLPYDLRDAFIQAGLAHVLAASGFHVSLLLGVVLVITRRYSVKTQLIVGLCVLGVYVSLTGLQPSVLRAALMGVGALVGLATDRKINPLGSLLLAATILLVINPLWIWDLGFQLSFLATLGLIVTVPTLLKWLDWLPPTIATLIAIPLAVFPWVLPLQLYTFGVIAPYSVIANVLATPLVVVISLGGMISGAAALIFPFLGSAIASLLYYPTVILIALVRFFTFLPGSSLTLGTISTLQLIILYGLILLVWQNRWFQHRWWVVGVFALTLIMIPMWHNRAALMRVTVLATNEAQVMVIQDRGKVILVNSGEVDTAEFTVIPFLRQEGINKVNVAIALNSEITNQEGWEAVTENVAIDNFLTHSNLSNLSISATPQPLPVGQTVEIGDRSLELVHPNPPILQLQLHEQTWLFIEEGEETEESQNAIMESIQSQDIDPKPQVLVWSGQPLGLEWLKDLQPQVAIAASSTIDSKTAEFLLSKQTQLYWTGRDGAIQWTPINGFERTIEVSNTDAPLL